MTTVEFFKWFIEEHPFLFVLSVFAVGGFVANIAHIFRSVARG